VVGTLSQAIALKLTKLELTQIGQFGTKNIMKSVTDNYKRSIDCKALAQDTP
jgi:hypothetical protein